jgi:chromosome segregation ATPase
MRQID